ncbi:hypothetical protein V1525DRAFT_408201 [Lipomyces kononenkoae]|uniref:Uncharacterized protein n=1 Tax=Lipomyces kononenkoae TaxID=34357 RepID=A0ACC3SWR9_LIPKO
MAGIRTKKPAKPTATSRHRNKLSSATTIKEPSDGLQMRVRREIDVGLGNASSPSSYVNPVLKSKTRSFGSLLKEIEKFESQKVEEQKNTIISRGLMGEGEITFTVDNKKKRRGMKDDNENRFEDGEEGRKRRDRDSGRTKQRFEGRRSASNNVLRKLG